MSWKKNADWKKAITALKLPEFSGQQWGILLLVGILLVVLALPVKENEDKLTPASGIVSENEKSSVSKTELENKLESLLSSAEGVGNVQVMLMTEEDSTDTFSGTKAIQVTGVLIAAQGGDNMVTVQNIKQAVMALFQLDAHKIKVMKMN